jgi:hypothetical protein
MKKTIYSALFAAAMLFVTSSAFAQVKIGTNPTVIEATSNLEVEASTAGRKVKVNKTTGQMTIADGTQGDKKILTSDANGGASWQPAIQNTDVALSVLAATQNITNGARTMDFASVEFDKGANFNVTTNEFTAPSAGYYQANLTVICGTAAGVQTGRYGYLLVNGGSHRLLFNESVASNEGYTVYSGRLVKLNAGDKLSIHIGAAAGGTTFFQITGGSLDIIKISN